MSLWLEPDSNEEHVLAWRGSVVHLMTQQRRYFTELVDLVAFLAAHAGTPGGPERCRNAGPIDSAHHDEATPHGGVLGAHGLQLADRSAGARLQLFRDAVADTDGQRDGDRERNTDTDTDG